MDPFCYYIRSSSRYSDFRVTLTSPTGVNPILPLLPETITSIVIECNVLFLWTFLKERADVRFVANITWGVGGSSYAEMSIACIWLLYTLLVSPLMHSLIKLLWNTSVGKFLQTQVSVPFWPLDTKLFLFISWIN